MLFFVILLLTGVIAANFFGQRLILAWRFVKSIYSSVKQVSDTLLSDKGNSALLVEFPRQGSWTDRLPHGNARPHGGRYRPASI